MSRFAPRFAHALVRATTAQLHTTPICSVNITFVEKGVDRHVKAIRGDSLMETAKDNQINLPAVCGGMCECSTCHVIADEATFSLLPEPEEEELDVLDVVTGVTDYSRLACQIDVTRALEGARFTVPESFNDMR